MAGAESRLRAARARLLVERPFLGALAMRLPLVEAPWCRSTGTDARRLYYNPDYVARLGLGQLEFVLAHEALHCALQHFARRGARRRRRWDLACDFAVNGLLLEEGLEPPPGVVALEAFRGLAAEEIYPCLEDEEGELLDEHLYEPGEPRAAGGRHAGGEGAGGPPRAPQGQAREALAAEWRRHAAAALEQARAAGRTGGAALRALASNLAPRLPWRTLLARHMGALARHDYGYERPSRREGEFALPTLGARTVDLVVALDTSASIAAETLAAFVAELDAIKGPLRARVTLLACDAALAPGGPWVFEPWEALRLPRGVRGGGGTDFRPVFAWVAARAQRPDALVYLTDARGRFPARPPAYPVIWVVQGPAGVPWGERIQLHA
ncbi:vWA domain-containing protein [Inmirania thermothiophila]|uniref:Putative metal-dependent peptidase n=1 Tax=Inmirania thermothiophila TaxID=1750597 RepID=A0A3N1XTH6_9GAMM|nr:VWA-like domain-containing protein [Inmirania thermothiophila]ROR29548.1 putative metal-dependent peptidase [Inmirania thermothiophila]